MDIISVSILMLYIILYFVLYIFLHICNGIKRKKNR